MIAIPSAFAAGKDGQVVEQCGDLQGRIPEGCGDENFHNASSDQLGLSPDVNR
jgi:hypothetical protein